MHNSGMRNSELSELRWHYKNAQFTMHNAQLNNVKNQKWTEKLTPTMVGADLWSPAVVGVTFYNIESIECNKQNHREARILV